MTDEKPEDGKRTPDLLERENSWFYSAVAAGFCGFALFIAGLMWAYTAYYEPDEFARKFDVLYRGALIGAAIVTFFTVVWRGLVSTRQVDAQTQQLTLIRRQLEHAEAQGKLDERNELAKLLQKGAELIDSDLRGHRSAGMSTLEFVLMQNRDFSQQAMDMLGEKFEWAIAENRDSRDAIRLHGIIRKSFRDLGRRAQIDVRMSAESANENWLLAEGFRSVTYHGGVVGSVRNDRNFTDWEVSRFFDVEFFDMNIVTSRRMRNCTFRECDIVRVHATGGMSHTFIECNFSNCTFQTEPIIKGEGNFYVPGHPPMLKDKVPMSDRWMKKYLAVLDT